MKEIELLSPAKNAETGKAAVDCGADAVYIGASKFGARAAAGNKLKEIEELVNYAHKFYARVYVTVNTLLYDDELGDAEILVNQIYRAGADAVIIKDMALLEMNLPPVPIFASTQANNYSLGRIKFLEQVGIKRVILARELSLNQIKEIRKNTSLELETFIHGALCVSLSGQCYLSEAICGRSANRGECSQPCRSTYDLIDSSGKIIIKDKHLLSLKDLNLSLHISDLIDAGITSFKIEGRLKDIDYVKNITAFYRKKIDEILAGKKDFVKSSGGTVNIPFTPDPEKTFNRGYSTYFLNSSVKTLSSYNTSKSIGEYLGTVKKVYDNYFELDLNKKIANGDGICFVDSNDRFTGTNINKTELSKIFPAEINNIKTGVKIFRNFDKDFHDEIIKSKVIRKINAAIELKETDAAVVVTAKDGDNNIISFKVDINKTPAQNEGNMFQTLIKQFKKSGDSIFNVSDVKIELQRNYFIPVGKINDIRRTALSLLEKERIKNFPRSKWEIEKNNLQFPAKKLDYTFNVTNEKAQEFYLRHGVEEIKPGFELEDDRKEKVVMKTKYCIKRELSICPNEDGEKTKFKHPLYLVNNKNKYKLEFDCKECFMKLKW